jgi:hypothetical protein
MVYLLICLKGFIFLKKKKALDFIVFVILSSAENVNVSICILT